MREAEEEAKRKAEAEVMRKAEGAAKRVEFPTWVWGECHPAIVTDPTVTLTPTSLVSVSLLTTAKPPRLPHIPARTPTRTRTGTGTGTTTTSITVLRRWQGTCSGDRGEEPACGAGAGGRQCW
jgi:hypothetical protein